jgi:VanZ family protein
LKNQPKYRLAAVIWAAVLLVISLQPARPGNIHSGPAHNVAHFLSFGALAFLAARAFGLADRISVRPALVSFFWGLMIEYLQHVLNRMPVEWYDVRDDTAGIIVFMILGHTLTRCIHSATGSP